MISLSRGEFRGLVRSRQRFVRGGHAFDYTRSTVGPVASAYQEPFELILQRIDDGHAGDQPRPVRQLPHVHALTHDFPWHAPKSRRSVERKRPELGVDRATIWHLMPILGISPQPGGHKISIDGCPPRGATAPDL